MAQDALAAATGTHLLDGKALIERRLDRAYLVETLSRLARVPTDVPLGFGTLMEPDDPKLAR
jgi:hypothetical protein